MSKLLNAVVEAESRLFFDSLFRKLDPVLIAHCALCRGNIMSDSPYPWVTIRFLDGNYRFYHVQCPDFTTFPGMFD